MRDSYPSAPCVVVGIDGSCAATQAAIWAVDEAVERDIPLSLLHAIDSAGSDPIAAAAESAFAEKSIRKVITRIETLGSPVKLEAQIVHSHPVAALSEASRSAAMMCIGSAGLQHPARGDVGSTASALALLAHCPLAIVPRKAGPRSDGKGIVLAVVDGSPASNTVLERSVAEARLRGAPLRVFAMPPPRHSDVADTDGTVELISRIATDLEHRVTQWRRNHPQLDVELAPVHKGLLNYLENLQRNAMPIQLIVVGPPRPGPVEVLLGPSGRAALEASGCTLLICDRQWWL